MAMAKSRSKTSTWPSHSSGPVCFLCDPPRTLRFKNQPKSTTWPKKTLAIIPKTSDNFHRTKSGTPLRVVVADNSTTWRGVPLWTLNSSPPTLLSPQPHIAFSCLNSPHSTPRNTAMPDQTPPFRPFGTKHRAKLKSPTIPHPEFRIRRSLPQPHPRAVEWSQRFAGMNSQLTTNA